SSTDTGGKQRSTPTGTSTGRPWRRNNGCWYGSPSTVPALTVVAEAQRAGLLAALDFWRGDPYPAHRDLQSFAHAGQPADRRGPGPCLSVGRIARAQFGDRGDSAVPTRDPSAGRRAADGRAGHALDKASACGTHRPGVT